MNRINITIIFSLLARPHARNEGRYLWYIRMDEPSCSDLTEIDASVSCRGGADINIRT